MSRRYAGTRDRNEARAEEWRFDRGDRREDEIASCHDLNHRGETAGYFIRGGPCCRINGKIRWNSAASLNKKQEHISSAVREYQVVGEKLLNFRDIRIPCMKNCNSRSIIAEEKFLRMVHVRCILLSEILFVIRSFVLRVKISYFIRGSNAILSLAIRSDIYNWYRWPLSIAFHMIGATIITNKLSIPLLTRSSKRKALVFYASPRKSQ